MEISIRIRIDPRLAAETSADGCNVKPQLKIPRPDANCHERIARAIPSLAMIIRNFVVLEGGDGTGTSTQLSILKERLAKTARAPLYSIGFEPTEGSIGTLIRLALRGDAKLRPDTVARLFAADRGEHLYSEGGVVERAGRGELVVSDRYVPSSLVYQGIACGEELPAALNAAFPKPELILFFDVDPRVAVRRIQARETKDEFEKLDFQILAKERYERILPEYAGTDTRIARIDASRPVEEVSEQVWSEIMKLPIFGE
jgi:dTMP kinase